MIYKDDLNNIVLEHHGVKGQKWGVRKAFHTAKASYAAKKASKAREKSWGKAYTNRAKMSEAQLVALNRRLSLENQLKSNIHQANPPKKSLVSKYAGQFGNQVMGAVIAGGAAATGKIILNAAKKGVAAGL
jgi:hypothetical protein